jgi:hypothetical protein
LYVDAVRADGGAVRPLVSEDRLVARAPRPLDIEVPNSRTGLWPAFTRMGSDV